MAKPKISANTIAGRILLALRAGRMTQSEIKARFASSDTMFLLRRLVAAGLVDKQGGDGDETYGITAAGRAACPNRRNRRLSEDRPCA